MRSTTRRGNGTYIPTHGDTKSCDYRSWQGMRQRVGLKTHHAYEQYGGRGISICDRWQSYELFLEDMGRRPTIGHTLDRIDNNGNYEKNNCRWATKVEQNRNRSDSNPVTINGETRTIAEWAEVSGIPKTTLHDRIRRRLWDPVEAITRPARPYAGLRKLVVG